MRTSQKSGMDIETTSEKRMYRKRGMNLFVLVALLLFAVGAYNIYQYHKTVENCQKVQGLLMDLHYTPPMNGYSSTLYPVFEYTVDGVTYRQEYQYQAVDGAEFSAMANDPELPDGKLKDILKKSSKTQPDFKVGQTYPLRVSRDNPKIFFIENQWVILQEAKWFIMGGILLALNFLFGLISYFAGR